MGLQRFPARVRGIGAPACVALALTVFNAVVVRPETLRAEEDATLREQVEQAETAFAATLAARDHAAFTSYLSAEAIFVGSTTTFRGREAVARGWKPYFADTEAPFSWQPANVWVLESGRLALSSGPVFGSDGACVGTFNSIWRLEDDGKWRVVFDKGCDACAEE